MVDPTDRLPAKLARLFKADPARWLLKARSPLVRYLTYTDLLGYSPDDPKPAALLPRIGEDPDLRAVLDSQAPDGFWPAGDYYFARPTEPRNLYGPKYAAAVWQLPILADLGFTADDEAPARAFELFARRVTADGFFDLTGKGHPLIRANAIACAAFLRMGWRPGDLTGPLTWLAGRRKADGGWADAHEILDADSPSTVATTSHVAATLGYADRVNGEGSFNEERVKASEFLGANLLTDYAGRFQPTAKPWYKLSWPQYDYDVITVCEALWAAGAPEGFLQDASELVIERQTPKGFWRQRVRLVVPTRITMVEPGHSSRWLTMKASKLIIDIRA
jgi:hypothetical protein